MCPAMVSGIVVFTKVDSAQSCSRFLSDELIIQLQLQLQLQLYSFTFNLQLHDSFHPRIIGEPNRGGGRDTQI